MHDNKVIDIAQHFDTEGQHLRYGDDHSRYSSGGGHPGGPGLPKDDRDPHYGGDSAGTLAQRRFFSPEHGLGPTVIPPSTPASTYSFHSSPTVQRRLQAVEGEQWALAEEQRKQAEEQRKQDEASRKQAEASRKMHQKLSDEQGKQAEEQGKLADEQRKQAEDHRKLADEFRVEREKQDGQNAKTDGAIADLQDAQKKQEEHNAKTDDRFEKLEADFSQFKVQQNEKVTKFERFAALTNKRQDESDALQTKIVAEVRKNS